MRKRIEIEKGAMNAQNLNKKGEVIAPFLNL